jgi:acetyl-CoA carboxylase biotin carboxyl carrier protein
MSAAKSDPIDTRLVRRLADILQDTGLTEIEVERGDLRVRVARELTAGPAQAPATYFAPAAPPPPAAAAPAQASEPVSAPAAAAARGDAVKSPMVGTVYLSPNPESDAFVQPGDKVSAGQTLLIIEAMKTMNPIPATKAGTVVEILVENEQPVEFGAPLVIIE